MTGVPLSPIEAIENLSSMQSPTKKKYLLKLKSLISFKIKIYKNFLRKYYTPIEPPFVVG